MTRVQHRLKSWPEFFEPICAGEKRHELRRFDDREFHIGDKALLEEFEPRTGKYTGRSIVVEITYVTSRDDPCAFSATALADNFCILSIEPVSVPA